MKTSELTGALLDYWVAQAEGLDPYDFSDWWAIDGDSISGDRLFIGDPNPDPQDTQYSPSTDWAQGGPIIEREMITVTPQAYDVGPATCSGWVAVDVPYGIFEDHKGRRSAAQFFSKSYLEAAMLCYVARKLGDEVEDLLK